MTTLRIPGLIRAMNDVRARLAAGIPPGEADAFRAHVAHIVEDVERICRTRRTRPADLPAPSYRAFLFLKTLDLRRLPIRPADAAPPPPHDFRVTNLVAICDDLHAAILALVDPAAWPPGAGDPRLAGLRAQLVTEAADTERICRQGGVSPADLPIRSRRAYQWLRLLAEPGNLEAHVATVAAALAAGRPRLADDRRLQTNGVRTVAPRLYHSNTLVGGRVEGDAYAIRMHQGLMSAPQAVVEAAVAAAFGEDWRLPVVRDYAHSAAFRDVMAKLEDPAGAGRADGGPGRGDAGMVAPQRGDAAHFDAAPVDAGGEGLGDHDTAAGPGAAGDSGSLIRDLEDEAVSAGASRVADLRATGRHHNLNASFDRVNRAYFGGRMPRPVLTWNATFTQRKLGHYDVHADTVMLSITLDDPKTPAYVVDFVVYHELLHKQLGVRAVNGRRRMHTPEFRRAERRFREWNRVERWLRGAR